MLIEWLEKLLGYSGRWIEQLSKKVTYVDLVGAFTASLVVSALIFLMDCSSGGNRNLLSCLIAALVSACSYLAAALLLQRFWTGTLQRILPHWLMIAVFGSLILACISGVRWMSTAWASPYRTEPDFSQFLLQELAELRFLFLFLTFLTLPFTATVHYAGIIVKWIDRWHNGPEQVISIIKNG